MCLCHIIHDFSSRKMDLIDLEHDLELSTFLKKKRLKSFNYKWWFYFTPTQKIRSKPTRNCYEQNFLLKQYTDTIFDQINKLTKTEGLLSTRIYFLLLGVTELRENNWKPRLESLKPVTIEKIRKEVEDEIERRNQVSWDVHQPSLSTGSALTLL